MTPALSTTFSRIDAAGNYLVGPSIDVSLAGSYSVQVQSVTVNGVTYGTSPTLVSPSTFTLTVVNPC